MELLSSVGWRKSPLRDLPLIKAHVDVAAQRYALVATDLVGVWSESMEGAGALEDRLRRDNPLLDLPVRRLLEILAAQFDGTAAPALSLSPATAVRRRRKKKKKKGTEQGTFYMSSLLSTLGRRPRDRARLPAAARRDLLVAL